ncbi:MAG: glutamate racemase [Burkholderiales bacterium]|nr:glutamate racemase [Burkholderiales bacterium]
MDAQPPLQPVAPIGVFDSGIGGLSILAALRVAMPREHFVYYADSGHAPYGEKGGEFVQQRSLTVAEALQREHGIKALVVACNTATTAAIGLLRERWPRLPIVGVEPALKPALLLTQTRRVGVIATRGTLESARVAALLSGLQHEARFVLQPCDGLAEAIERNDTPTITALSQRYLRELGKFGHAPGEIDTLVLGCTHYPLVIDTLIEQLPEGIELVHTGPAVARQCVRVLQAAGLQHEGREHAGEVIWRTSGEPAALQDAARRWLGLG